MKINDIKKQASLSLEGNLTQAIGITIFYTIIVALFGFIPNLLKESISNELLTLLKILLNIIILPFSYGMIASLVKLSKGEKVAFTDFINIGMLNYFKIIQLILLITLKLIPFIIPLTIGSILVISNLPNEAIKFLGLVITIVSTFLIINKALDYILFNFITCDDPNKKCKDILTDSKTIIKNNKLKFILLTLSYILWFVLFGLLLNLAKYFVTNNILEIISSLLIALITPFITISQYLLYEDLKNNK